MTNPGKIAGTFPVAVPGPWFVSYNNEPPIQVQAITERQAISEALKLIGIPSPIHPIRAWPKKEQS